MKNDCPSCEREAGSPTLARGLLHFHCAACGRRWVLPEPRYWALTEPALHARHHETLGRLRQLLGRSQRLEAVWARLQLGDLLALVAAAERARVRAHRAGAQSARQRRLR